jgi:hypothetical protein
MARPRRYPTPELLAATIAGYFAEAERAGARPSMGALARHLGFRDRGTLARYRARSSGFEQVVAMARQRIEVDLAERLFAPTEDTFAIMRNLVNNFGWAWPEGWLALRSRPRDASAFARANGRDRCEAPALRKPADFPLFATDKNARARAA